MHQTAFLSHAPNRVRVNLNIRTGLDFSNFRHEMT